MPRLVLLAVLLLSPHPLPLHAGIDLAPPAAVPAAGLQSGAAIATDGTDFFAVWSDTRSGNRAVYGTRVRADGEVLDPLGILIARRGEDPAVTWDGSRYVVVWAEYTDLFAVPVSRSGEVGQRVALGRGTRPAIASNGNGSLVAFRSGGGWAAFIALSPSLTSAGTGSLTPALIGEGPSVAPLGNEYFVAWTRYVSPQRVQEGVFVAPDAAGQQLPIMALGTGGASLRLATSGDRLLAAWVIPHEPMGSFEPPLPRMLQGRIVTPAGPGETLVILEEDDDVIGDVTLAPDSEGFAMVWMKKVGTIDTRINSVAPSPFQPTFDLYRTTISRDGGTVRTEPFIESSESETQPAIASNGSTLLAAWIRRGKIAAAVVPPAREPVGIEIARSAAHQETPRVVWAGDRWVVVWSEDRASDGRHVVFLRAISPAGRHLQPAPVPVSEPGRVSLTPALACDDEMCLVAWQEFDGRRTAGRRVSKEGKILDPEPLVFQSGAYLPTPPAVAAGGGGFAVLHGIDELTLSFVDGPAIRHETLASQTGAHHPSMAWDGEAFVAVWTDMSVPANWRIRAARIRPLGQPQTVAVPNAGTVDSWPSVACIGRECLVAWRGYSMIRGMHLIDGVSIPIEPRGQSGELLRGYMPNLTAAGSRFVLAWWDVVDEQGELRTASIGRDGRIDPDPLVSAAIRPVLRFGVASAGPDQLAIVYSAPHFDAPYAGAQRVKLRLMGATTGRRRAVSR